MERKPRAATSKASEKPVATGKRKHEPEYEEEGLDSMSVNTPFFRKLVSAVKNALGSRSRKEKQKAADELPPFSIPPSETNIEVFELKNPFVEVVSEQGVNFIDQQDKVQMALKEPMSAEALRLLMDELVLDVIRSKAVARTELGYRDIHVNFIKPFVSITKLAKPDIKGSIRKRQRLNDVLLDDNGQEGLEISVQVQLEGHIDPEDSALCYEGDGTIPESTADQFNIKVMVHDSRINDGDNLVTVAYVECKKDDDALPESIFQAGVYGKHSAVENMARGRYSPIYLQGFSKTSWLNGMLIPFGSITVKDGHIAKIDTVYPEQDAPEVLSDVLKAATLRLRKAYPEHSFYPDGVYLSGVLYADQKARRLPLESVERADALFYQTWLQIVCGNEARKLSADEIRARLASRKNDFKQVWSDYKERSKQTGTID